MAYTGTGLACAAIILGVLPWPAVAGDAGVPAIAMLSRARDGGGANGLSLLPSTNQDGSVVAFKSSASNLVEGDRNRTFDVFVVERGNGAIERASLAAIEGQEADGSSFPPVLDDTGDRVVFGSQAGNLVIGDFNGSADLFVYDRGTGEMTNATLTFDDFGNGVGGGGVPDRRAGTSADASVVGFTSVVDSFVAEDDNQAADVYVRDLTTDSFELISFISAGSEMGRAANGPSVGGAISADGCRVVFYSDASNIVPGDRNNVRDVFLRDRCAQTMERISVRSDGGEADAPSAASGVSPVISRDGSVVVFSSDAALAGTDSNGLTDVFARNLETGTTELLSGGLSGEGGDSPSGFASVSADGRFVVFQSGASNLVDGDTNDMADVFVIDRRDGRILRLSVDSSGNEGNGDSILPYVSGDGRIVVFQSDADNLVEDDDNGTTDIFATFNRLSLEPTPTPTLTASNTATATETATPTATATSTNTHTPEDTPTPEPTTPGTLTPGTETPGTITPGTQTPGTQTPTHTGGIPTVVIPDDDGCSCSIDPQTRTARGGLPLHALLLPLALLSAKRRDRGARRGRTAGGV